MDPNLTPQYIAYAVLVIVISLSIHEFMHAYVSHLLGDRTAQLEGRLSLNPLDHIDPVMTVALPIITLIAFGVPILAAKPVPFNPEYVKYDEFGAALIAAAGPVSNLVLAFLGALVLRLTGGSGVLSDFFSVFVVLNVALFVFNLIPIPPLDGSRVLYAFAPEPLQNLMRSIEPFGLLVIFALVLLGGFGGLLVNINQAILNLLP